MNTKTKLIGAAVSVAALSAVGVGVAAADPQPSPATPSSSATPNGQTAKTTNGKTATKDAKKADRKQHRRNLLKSALHGEATVGGVKKQHTIDFQRGTVTAVSTSSVSIKSVDGFTASYAIGTTTKVHKASRTATTTKTKGQTKATIAEVKVNDRVRVVGLKDGSKITLSSIGDQGPKK